MTGSGGQAPCGVAEPVLHVPGRPGWCCTTCAELWPCAPARAAMLAEQIATDDRIGLMLRLGQLLALAIDELPAEQAESLYERFVGWARPLTRRAQTSAGEGLAGEEGTAMQQSKEGLRAQLGGVTWRKSTRSGPYSDNCVEVALLAGGVALRDSKDNGTGPVLVFDTGEWTAFLGGATDGEFAPS